MTAATDRTSGVDVDVDVVIVGAGPAGLLLAHLLHLQGIDAVVLEKVSREYAESRVRAGILEQPTVDLLREVGVADRLDREALVHDTVVLRFGRRSHPLDLRDLTGSGIAVYGQQELVKDLIGRRTADGLPLHFEVTDVEVHDPEGRPRVAFVHEGTRHVLRTRVVAGCDGTHGVCRDVVSPGPAWSVTWPVAWLGVLADAPPSEPAVVYARHERGFALHSMRGADRSRLYLQVAPDDDGSSWSDDRIWSELALRLADVDGFVLNEGPILERSVFPLRASVTPTLQRGRVFLAGDAAHVVPATGAKGLNLAVADVCVLSRAVAAHVHDGRDDLLDRYTADCAPRIWSVQHFAARMTSMLHTAPGPDAGFDAHVQQAALAEVVGSASAATAWAAHYAGLPFATHWRYAA